MRSLRLWESLEVPELRYNRVEVVAGTSWRSQGGGIIESVTMQADNISGTVVLKLEEGDIGRVAVDDLCMGIWHYPSGNATDNHDDSKGNYGERVALRGGSWALGSRAGVFALNLYYTRSLLNKPKS